MLLRLLAFAAVACLCGPPAVAYSLLGTRWTGSAATMHLQLGATSGPLLDGSASWDAVAENALNVWNAQLRTFQFSVARNSTAARSQGNRISNVFFANDVSGEAWGSGVLAVTVTYRIGSSQTETDVVFNNQRNWNSYRGSLRYSSSGAAIYDLHRVALHEFGHALGLDHPDEAGQRVTALMNSRVGSLDTLAADDIQGGQALYGAPSLLVGPGSPPATPIQAPTPTVAPSISSQPPGQTVVAGSAVTMSVTASGTAPLSYAWRRNGAVVGTGGPVFTLASAQPADAGSYTVTVSNPAGSATSAAATLVVTVPPTVVATAGSQAAAAGDRVTLGVTGVSGAPFAYQWIKDGADIPGATRASLSFAALLPADAGRYAVRLTSAAGVIVTPAAELTVRFSRLVNLSTRAHVPAGGAMVPGFHIRGVDEKPLVIRAVGPTLALFGVDTALSKTSLQVIAQDSSATLATNSSWGGGSQLGEAFARVGAFPLAAQSNDAAVQANLAARGYSVRVTAGDASLSGVTLAEIYDAEPLRSASQLVNVSTLGHVGTGDRNLTAGFAIAGNVPKRLLIRAVGPGLAAFNVGERLANPQFSIVPLGRAEPLAANEDWLDDAPTRAAFVTAGAFALPSRSLDAAIVITLDPGAYTVVVSGTDGGTGNALVEIYDLDPWNSDP